MRDRIEQGLEGWGHFVFRHRGETLAVTALLTAGLAVGLGALRIETSLETFLLQDDPVRVAYDAFRTRFVSDERVLLIVGSDEPFAFDFFERLRALHADLEDALPHVEEVTSLVNARFTRGVGDEIRVEDFLEDWPETSADLERLRERALGNPVYRNVLLSEDARYTVVTIRVAPEAADNLDLLAGFDDDPSEREQERAVVAAPLKAPVLGQAETAEIMAALVPIVARHGSPSFRVRITGAPAINHVTATLLRSDMARFTALALGAIALLLFALFRRPSGVLLPLLVVILSLVGTAGFMGLADLPVTAASQILPSFLLAVGMCFAVHLLAVFYRRFDASGTREEALVFSLGHSGLAVIMTSLTTAGSLFSFYFADLAILADFGLAAPIGVLLALVYTLVLLPALVAVLPIRARRRGADDAREGMGRLDRPLLALGDFSVRRPGWVLAVWALVLAAGALGAAQLRLSHSPLEWIPEDDPYRQTFELMDRELRSSMNIEVVVDSGEPSGLTRPEVLRALEEMKRRAMTLGVAGVRAGNALSVGDLVKETHQALNANDPARYAIPGERPLVAQELLLFEQSGPDELAKLADAELRRARLSILLNYVDSLEYKVWVEALRRELAPVAGPLAGLEITGRTMLMVRGLDGVLQGMLRSYAIALLVIVPLMIAIVGELGKGLASMVPNVIPIVVALGVMYVADIPLDIFTVLIGSICIGVAVDDTIHFMHNFRRYFERYGDARRAVRETLLTTGRALLVTSVVLSCGFLVFVFGRMGNVADFGVLTALTVATAFLADVTLSPAALTLLTRRARSATPRARDAGDRAELPVGSGPADSS